MEISPSMIIPDRKLSISKGAIKASGWSGRDNTSIGGMYYDALGKKYVPPQNFYGVGGMKIFRDLIWLMQGMMKADHKFYKKHKQYDFPQKQMGRVIAMYLVGSMMASPKVKSKMGNAMNEGMLMPYNKVMKDAQKKK